LLPYYSAAESIKKLSDNSYYLFSGQGIPSIYNHAANAIKDINSTNAFGYLLICLDGEDAGIENRKGNF
jgi:hypothetical protein